MNLPDKIELEVTTTFLNENLNETNHTEWVDLGKCFIMPNTRASKVKGKASKVKGNDGKEYIYSYEIVMKKPKGHIPKENDRIHILKKDGTIDKVCEVSGFVTLRNWLKLWV